MVPHVLPSDSKKLPFCKIIEAKEDIPVAFRSRQCETMSVPQTKNFTWNLCTQTTPNMQRYITVGFQTARGGDQNKNPAVFDHVKVIMIRAKVNTHIHIPKMIIICHSLTVRWREHTEMLRH
jgi:hypothetical protein